jgi:hypothetical protein
MCQGKDSGQAASSSNQVQNDIVPALGEMIPMIHALERWGGQIDTQK